MNQIMLIIFGLLLSIMIFGALAPFSKDKILFTKVETEVINKQNNIFKAIENYIDINKKAPDYLEDLVATDLLNVENLTNGFGHEFTFEANLEKGNIKIFTILEDEDIQEMFLFHFKNNGNVSKINDTTFETNYTMKNKSSMNYNGILVQSETPDPTKYKYWYNTTGEGEPIFMISNGENWVAPRLTK